MRAAAWGGAAPSTDTEARQRLIDAARRCFERFGPDKTTVADVAAEAGVGRRTVYRYFESSDELLRAAFALAAGGIVERMIAYARSYQEPGERIIEAMLFLLREIPTDPRIGPLLRAGASAAARNMSSVVTLEVSHRTLRAVLAEWSPLRANDVDELAELILRLLHSFLTEPGTHPRSEQDLRAFLRGWLLPAFELKCSGSKTARPQAAKTMLDRESKQQSSKLPQQV